MTRGCSTGAFYVGAVHRTNQKSYANQIAPEEESQGRLPAPHTHDSSLGSDLSVYLQPELRVSSRTAGSSARWVSADLDQRMIQPQYEVDRFYPVLPNSVKSKPPHGKGMKCNFTDFTYSLWREDMCRGSCDSAIVPNLSLPVERIGKIGKIDSDLSALLRFVFYRDRLNAGKISVKSRSNPSGRVEVSA